jgi:multidrug efflux system membrane fusion protein
MEPISVIFTIPEDSLPTVISHMRQGQLMVKAMTRDLSSELATGVLETINNQIDQTTGTVQLKAVFDNKDRALWPNQFVNARLLLDTQRDAIVIPSAAIQTGSQGTFVYLVKQDHTVDVRPVTVAVTEGNISSISSGLTGGEMVVTDGQDRLQEGVTVDARPGGDAQAQAAAPKASNTGKSPTGPPPGVPPVAPGERGQFGGQNGGQRNPNKQYRPDQGGQQQGVPKT